MIKIKVHENNADLYGFPVCMFPYSVDPHTSSFIPPNTDWIEVTQYDDRYATFDLGEIYDLNTIAEGDTLYFATFAEHNQLRTFIKLTVQKGQTQEQTIVHFSN